MGVFGWTFLDVLIFRCLDIWLYADGGPDEDEEGGREDEEKPRRIRAANCDFPI